LRNCINLKRQNTKRRKGLHGSHADLYARRWDRAAATRPKLWREGRACAVLALAGWNKPSSCPVEMVDGNVYRPLAGNRSEVTILMRLLARVHLRPAARTLCLGMTALMLGSGLAGCAGSSGTEAGHNAPTPVSLTRQRDPAAAHALTGPIDETELRKAVERYRLSKQRNASQIDFAGADLNGDGRSEALVLFSGSDWCLRTGCSLVIFQEEETGFRPVSHITRIRPPVLIGPDSNFGWRDLIANTGGGPAPIRTVRLGFTGKGYPINALLQPEPVQELLARAQQVIGESSAFTAAMNQAATQSTAQ
jgi:hypothetical protein